MTRTRFVRIAAACTAVIAASLIVAGSTSADPPRHDLVATALAIPSTPGTDAEDNTTRFETARGHSAKIDGVATTSLNCDGCSGHAFTVQVAYVRRPRALVADNVATAWASGCVRCGGWAVSLQIVVARSERAVTAANRALAFTADCGQCAVKAAAIQIVVIAASERELTPRQTDDIQALCDKLVAEVTPTASPAKAGAHRSPQTAPDQSTATITAAAERIQAIAATGLRATSATHAVAVRG
jgi:hypothetical protein